MSELVLSFKPTNKGYGHHDPSAALFRGSNLVAAVEEERLNRRKHAEGDFPVNAIRTCLDEGEVSLSDIDKILLPYRPKLRSRNSFHNVKKLLAKNNLAEVLYRANQGIMDHLIFRFYPTEEVRRQLSREFTDEIPPIETRPHHLCHAASAFHPSGFDNGLVFTLDGEGEFDSTVVWRGSQEGLERIDTYKSYNSLGHFFGAVTEYLGFRAFNGEGKVMGLAPYGSKNEEIEEALRSKMKFSHPYNVSWLTSSNKSDGVDRLENLFDRERKEDTYEFSDWEKDFAFMAQKLLEEAVVGLVTHYCQQENEGKIALAGGVALNCKMNKRVMEIEEVDEVFVQPVAHDGGLALGANWNEFDPEEVKPMNNVYWGQSYDTEEIEDDLKKNKLDYYRAEDLEKHVAEKIADGEIVGWFQGRMEMGPRALGNRSILADPRTEKSRSQVNRYVKHREEWRPFAPSILEEKMDEYLVDSVPSPYMIKTFDTVEERRDEMSAVLHPGDQTTRPQSVTEDQNPRYHRLISEFKKITDVPILLNTSFNDHGEPIVNTPMEAVKDFYGMGLDTLVVDDLLLTKETDHD